MISGVEAEEVQQLAALEQLPAGKDALTEPAVAGEPESKPEAVVETVDWKTLAEQAKVEADQLRAEVTKLRNDSRSRAVYQMRQDERDTLLKSVEARMDALTKANSAIVSRLASGDTAGIADEVQNIQRETDRTLSASRFEAGYNALSGQLLAAVKGSDGENVLDPSEFEAIRQKWNSEVERISAGKRAELGAFVAMIAEASDMRARKEISNVKKQLAEARRAEKEARKEVLDGARVSDLAPSDGGSPSSSAGVTKENIDALYMKGKVPDDRYRAFLRTGKI